MFIVCLFYELGIKSSNGGYVSLMLEIILYCLQCSRCYIIIVYFIYNCQLVIKLIFNN